MKTNSPKNSPYASDKTVDEGCGDISPFPYVSAGRLGHWEFAKSIVNKLKKSN